MKWRFAKYVFAVTLIALSSCQKDTVYGSGMRVEDVRTIIGGYSKIKVRNGLILVINPTLPKERVIIKCDEELLPYVSVKTSLTNELSVGYKNSFSFDTPLETEVHISGEGVDSYDLRHSKMYTSSTLVQDSLTIKIAESEMALDITAHKMYLTAEQCDKVKIAGSAEMCEMVLSEASDIDAIQLETGRIDAIIATSRANVWCNKQLNASLTEGSSLYYLGDCMTNVDATRDSQCIKMDKTTRQ